MYKNIKTNTDKNILLLFLLPLDIGLVFLDNRIKSAYQIPWAYIWGAYKSVFSGLLHYVIKS